MYRSNSVLDKNFEEFEDDLIGSTQNFDSGNRFGSGDLRPIEEIPHPYQQIFADYPGFNVIQSKVIDDILYTDDSLVISAPTGSGKTVIFELAMVRLLMALERTHFSEPFKIVYISPMKALCEERVVDWHKKFSDFGITSISVTGDSENIEFQNLLNHNLIITTPEKWDCLTRKWRENIKLVQVIKLFMIDEIHLLNEESRGSSLETIVCRMKTIEECVNSQGTDYSNLKIRFVAVSAAVPNIEDIAEWLGTSSNAKCFKFSDDYRPVKLKKIVLGYPYNAKTPFKFDLSLNYKLHSLIMEHSDGKPTLIFCGTRKIVEMTAKHILQHLTINLKPEQKQRLVEAAAGISDTNVKDTLAHGVGYHHAGMLPQTRKVIENLFRNSDLPILVTTSTLAMGVNLPAHLVIIKSTKCYSEGGFRDYSETALSQMIGRAGRPQYDTEATALILTTTKDKEKFEKMIGKLQPVESDLHRHLIEHLNAEVVLQTITDLGVAMRWLSSTFLHIRARRNPRYYGLTSSDPAAVDRRLLDMCQIELNKLIKAGMLTIDQDVLLKATPVGAAMAKYYLAFETMKLFTEIGGGEILQQILALISKCHEFSEMYLRVNDKKCLNLLNKCRNRETIRFPLNGKIKTLDMKINCIIQAVLGCLDICDQSILTEALKIMRNGERIVRCLIEYLESKDKCYRALLNTIILSKCFTAKLWENSPYVSKQLPGIGKVMSSQLVNAGKTNFQLLAECDPREIELLINKKPPAGSKILEQIHYLPKYNLNLETHSKNTIKLTVSLQNADDLERTCTVNRNSSMYLIVGDVSNNILFYGKYSHSFLIENSELVKIIEFEGNLEDVEANFISEDWVGIDCTAKFEVLPKSKSKEVGKSKVTKKSQNDDMTYMQTFMEMYMKCKKNKEAQMVQNTTTNDKATQNEEKKDSDENRNGKIIIRQNITIFDKNQSERENQRLESLHNTRKEDLDVDTVRVSRTPQNKRSLSDGGGLISTNNNTSFVVKNFQFTPRKQLAVDRNLHLGQSQGASSANKSQNTENSAKSQTKITWRSPLTYSPPVKFSPKISYNPLNTSGIGSDRFSSSVASPISVEKAATPNRTQTFFPKTQPKSNLSQPKLKFPLSDKAFADSSLDESMERRNEILEKVGDIASTSFLESFGLISPVQRQKVQSQIPNTNYDYYNQLLSQPLEQKNSVGKGKIPYTPSRRNFNKNEQSETILETRSQNLPKSCSGDYNRFVSQEVTSNESRYFNKRNDVSVDEFRRETKSLPSPKVNLKALKNSPRNQFARNYSMHRDREPPTLSRASEFLNRTGDSDRLDRFQNQDRNFSFCEKPFTQSENCVAETSTCFGRREESFFNDYEVDKGFNNRRTSQYFEEFPSQKFDAVSPSNNLVRQSFQEAPKDLDEIVDTKSNDPFDDSFESMFIDYKIPSQVLQFDNQTKRSLSRRSSGSHVDQDDRRSYKATDQENPFGENLVNYQRSSHNQSMSRKNSFDQMSENSKFPYLRQTQMEDFGGFQYIPNNERNYQRFSPRPSSSLPLRQNIINYDGSLHPSVHDRNQGYQSDLHFRQNNNLEPTYLDCRQNSNYYDRSTSQRNMYTSPNDDIGNSESYSYLRRIMEKENDPVSRDVGLNRSFRNFEPYGPADERRRVYLDKPYAYVNVPSQNRSYDNTDFELNRPYSRNPSNQVSYTTQSMASPYKNYPKPQYTETERERYYGPYHPYRPSPTAKNYIMRRFLNTMKNEPDDRSGFYH